MAYREIINAATDFYTSRNQKKKDEEQHGGGAAQWALNRTGGGRSNATAASSDGGRTASYREPEVAEEYADGRADSPRYGETAQQQPKLPRLPGTLGNLTRATQAAVSPEKFAREQKNRMQAAADAYGSTTQRLRVESALRKGDYAEASRLLDEMTGEGTPRAQRQQTADFINSLYDDPSRWNGNKTANRREAWRNTDAYMEELQGLDLNQFSPETRAGADRLLDAYDRDPRQLADLLESEEGAAILEAIERERGGQHEGDAQAAAWENLRNSRERYLTQNANYDFFQRGQEQIDRAAQSETGRAQMDSYLRAQSATLALNDLYNYLDVGGNAEAGGGHGLNTYSAQYLIDELAGYGVDLRGMDESNYRQAVEQALQEQGQRARIMGAALRQAGYDPEAVERVVEYTRQNQQNQARRESVQQAVGNAGLLDRAALHLASTAENVWLSPLENIATWAQLGAGRGNINQPGSYVPVASTPTDASLVRGAIADTMTPTGAFFYNALSSAADSFLNVSSFGGAGSLASMGANAATQEANDILARGGSNRQAVTGGLAAGAIEVLTEIASVENLINIRNSPGSIRDMLKSVGVQMFTEGSEEINSEVLGLIVDGLNMGNLSETSQAVQQYTAQGMSYEEAKRRVLLDNVKQVAVSGLAGAVSGGVSGGATAIGTSIGNSLAQRAAQRQAVADFGTEMEQLYRQEAARRQAAQSGVDAGGGAIVPAGMIAPYGVNDTADGPGNPAPTGGLRADSPRYEAGEPGYGGQIARATDAASVADWAANAEATGEGPGNPATTADVRADSPRYGETARATTEQDVADEIVRERTAQDEDAADDFDSLAETVPPEPEAPPSSDELSAGDRVPQVSLREFADDVGRIYPAAAGQRQAARQIVAQLADEIVKTGIVSQEAVDNAAQALEQNASWEAETDPVYTNLRQEYKGQRIYVSEQLRRELGDDWKQLRQAAQKAGVTLMSRNSYTAKRADGSTVQREVRGADELFTELAEAYPSLFDGENYNDLASFLWDFVDAMETGKGSQQGYDAYIQSYGAEGRAVHEGLRSQLMEAAQSFLKNAGREQQYAEQYGGRRRKSGALAETRQIGNDEYYRNQQNAVGAAAREGVDFSGAAQTLSEAVDRYGAHPEGSVHSDTRSVEIPTQLDEDTHVSRAARTFAEAQSVDNSFVSRVVEPAIANGEFNITPDGNERQLRAGREWVDQHTGTQTITDAVQDWRRAVAQGERGMNRTALQAAGFTLLTRLANGTRTEMSPEARQQYDRAAVEVMTTLQGAVSESARLLQMQRLLQRMSPEMQVYSAQTAISQLEAALGERGIRNADGRLHVNAQLLENFRSALESNDEQRISEARAALYRDIASQTRATIQDKLNAWRYLCMLGNPRTIIRNLIGNVGFGPMVTVSNRVQAGLQAIFTPQEQRTKSLQPALFATEQGRQAMDFARNDYQNVEDELKGEGKFGRNGGGISGAARELQNVIREYHSQLRVFGIRQWQQATEWGLNSDAIGDGRFLRGYYSRALAQTIVARGYNVETRGNLTYLTDKNGNLVAQQTFEDMQADAIRQAQRATYRDANAVTNLMKKLRPKGNSRAAQVGRLLVDANLPFVSTPTNIMMRMVEFGPIGLTYTLMNETRRLANGDISQTEFFEKLSNGLTGTGVFLLGMLLSSHGIVTGGRPDDKDEREGVGRYTLNIGDKSVSLDWLAPAAPILLSGATLNEALNEEHKSAIDAVFSAAGAYFEPMLEASYLSGLQNLVESMSYTEEKGANALYSFTIGSIMSYLSQYIPTLAGQAAATARDEITYTYTGDVEGALSKQFTRSVASIGKKLGLDQMGVDIRQQPRLDDWGRETDAGSTGERALNNFLNPASVSQVRRTDVDAEIERLQNATDETGLAPSRRGYTITVNKEKVRLNGDQYTEYQRTYGQTAFSLIEEMMQTPAYQRASNKEKAEMVKKCYDIADERAKVAAGVGYQSEDKLVGLMDKGLSVADAYAAKSYHDALNDYGKDEGGSRAVSPAGAENLTGPAQWAVAGLGGGQAAQTAEPYTKNEKAARFKNWVQGQSWTEAQKQAVLDAYGTYTSMTFSDTERFDKLERYGLSGDDSTRIMEAIGDLEPIGDAQKVTDAQQWELIVNDEKLSEEQKIAAMWGYMDDSQQKHLEQALSGGCTAGQYLDVYEAKKTHGNEKGNWTKATLKSYLDNSGYSSAEKYWLFEAFKGNVKNNPYSYAEPVEHWTPPEEDEEPTAAEADEGNELTGAARWALAMGGG